MRRLEFHKKYIC